MIEYHEPSNSANDPLERLVEAFIEQSVPEGPDAAVQRRLLAALPASRTIMLRSEDDAAAAMRRGASSSLQSQTSRWRTWTGAALRQTAGLAAGMAAVIAAAVYMGSGPSDRPAGSAGVTHDPTAVAALGGAHPSPALETPAGEDLARRLVDSYLRTHDGQRPDRQAINAMIADMIEDNPNLATAKSWQFAQQRLSRALKQPELIGVGVGLLGTLPLATYARF